MLIAIRSFITISAWAIITIFDRSNSVIAKIAIIIKELIFDFTAITIP